MSKFEDIVKRVNTKLEEGFTTATPPPAAAPTGTQPSTTPATGAQPVQPTTPTKPPTTTYDATHPAIQNIAKETDPNKILKMLQDLKIALPAK